MNEPARDVPPPEASRELARLRREAADARERSRRSGERVLEVEQELAVSQARALSLERSLEEREASLEEQRALVAELGERLARADRVMSAMKRSLSWRVTAPLRALRRGR